MKNLLIILFALTLTGCFDEKSYVIEPIPIEDISIPYSVKNFQTFFYLKDTLVVAHINNDDWDLGFESTPTGYHIFLNNSKTMFAGNTGLTDFASVTSPEVNTTFDMSSGNIDSTAIGNWGDFSDVLNPIYPKNVYIINLGKNDAGVAYGYKKIIFEKLENSNYFIHYANLDNTDEHSFQVPKNSALNFVQFSFNNGGNLDVQQPEKALWDLKFTKYTSILYDKGLPVQYTVRGVLINSGILVAKDLDSPFYSIDITKIGGYSFSAKQDIIGYNWKLYKDGVYSIIPNLSYIIKDRDDNYFKIRFTEYTSNGDISFEMEKLNNQ